MSENGIKTRHPLVVIVFTDEEGGLIGSKAITGTLTSEALEVESHSGKTVRQGITALGGNPDELNKAIRKKQAVQSHQSANHCAQYHNNPGVASGAKRGRN